MRRLALGLLLSTALTLGGAGSALAATITVTSPADSGAGTLRQAVAGASGGDTIRFHASLDGQTITLASPISVTQDLTVQGPANATVTISGNDATRIFNIDVGSDVTIADLRLTHGRPPGGSPNPADGGAILNAGSLTLRDSAVTDSQAGTLTGCPMFSSCRRGRGGAIASRGELTVVDSTFTGNQQGALSGSCGSFSSCMGGIGGAILFDAASGDLTISGSTFRSNTVSQMGGAVGILNADDVTIDASTFDANDAGNSGMGGGIGVGWPGTGPAHLTVSGSTFSGNHANLGGGLSGFATGAPLTIRNSTLTANSAQNFGGAIDVQNEGTKAVVVQSSTIADNSAQTTAAGIMVRTFGPGGITVQDTILTGNTASRNPDCEGAFDGASDHNLLANVAGCTLSGLHNLIGVSPGLGALADNGGPTQTRALAADSPAVDAGSNPASLSSDQRGLARVSGAAADLGAFEYQQTFGLSVAVSGAAANTVTSDLAGIGCAGGASCDHDFANGATVTLTAHPAPGHSFAGWSGACSGTAPTCAVHMSQARQVGATFAADPDEGGNTSAPPPPPDKPALRVRRAALTSAVVVARGVARVSLRCQSPDGKPCRGRMILLAPKRALAAGGLGAAVASQTFRVASGHVKQLRARVGYRARRYLARNRRLQALAVLRLRQADGSIRKQRVRIALRAR